MINMLLQSSIEWVLKGQLRCSFKARCNGVLVGTAAPTNNKKKGGGGAVM